VVGPGRAELAAAMGLPSVVVRLVVGQDRPQMSFAEDQQPVGDLGPGGEHILYVLSQIAVTDGDSITCAGGKPRRLWPWTISGGDLDHERDGSEPATIFRVAEAEIPADLMHQVQELMQTCFPGYPSRAYFKLPPHFRYLARLSGP
jgi:hypothetical protein